MAERDIAGWQRRFRAAPAVWAVIDNEGCITNLYDSESAAQRELAALPKARIELRRNRSLV